MQNSNKNEKKDSATLQNEYRGRLTSEEAQKKRAANAAYMRTYRARKNNCNPAKKTRVEMEYENDQQPTDSIAGTNASETMTTECTEENGRLARRRAISSQNLKDYGARQRAKTHTTVTVQTTSSQNLSQNEERSLQLPTITTVTYDESSKHDAAHAKFKEKILDNDFGYAYSVCGRLWYSRDLKPVPINCMAILVAEFPQVDFEMARVCSTCHVSLRKEKIPTYSTSNGFKYPP